MTCHETTQSLGAYVLGSLDVADRSDVDRHLLDCPACAAELAEIQELPQFLRQLRLQDVDELMSPNVEPADDLFDRVAAAARRERDAPQGRPRRRLLLAVAAAVVVVVGGAGAGIGLHAASQHGTPTFAATSGQIHMSVTVTGRTSGTDLVVSVAGLPVDENCTLIAVSRDGVRDTAGSWVATYSGTAQVTGSTTIPRSQLAEFILLGSSGEQLVTVPV